MKLLSAHVRLWRLSIAAATLWGMCGVVAASAAAPAEGTPAGQAAEQEQAGGDPDPFIFASDAAYVMWQVKADAAADFELVWRVIRQRVESAGDAQVRAVVLGMKIYSLAVATGEARTYVFQIDPVIKTASYSPTFLLYESKLFERVEADELFQKMMATLMPDSPVSTMPLDAVR